MRGPPSAETSQHRPRRLTIVVIAELVAVLTLSGLAVVLTPRCPRRVPERASAVRTTIRPQAGGEVDRVVIRGAEQHGRPEPPHYPAEWLPSRGDECHRYRDKTVCEGPRKVPRPVGEPARLAKTLGIGTRAAAGVLLTTEPPREWVLAVEGHFTDAFPWPVAGGRRGRGFRQGMKNGVEPDHNGIDIGAPRHAPIRAVADGLVVYSDNQVSGYGNLLMILHVDGSVAMYGHCEAILVFGGQQVEQGQVVAEVGSTAVTQGTHLHFELRQRGEPVDPWPLFLRWRLLNDPRAGARPR